MSWTYSFVIEIAVELCFFVFNVSIPSIIQFFISRRKIVTFFNELLQKKPYIQNEIAKTSNFNYTKKTVV